MPLQSLAPDTAAGDWYFLNFLDQEHRIAYPPLDAHSQAMVMPGAGKAFRALQPSEITANLDDYKEAHNDRPEDVAEVRPLKIVTFNTNTLRGEYKRASYVPVA